MTIRIPAYKLGSMPTVLPIACPALYPSWHLATVASSHYAYPTACNLIARCAARGCRSPPLHYLPSLPEHPDMAAPPTCCSLPCALRSILGKDGHCLVPQEEQTSVPWLATDRRHALAQEEGYSSRYAANVVLLLRTVEHLTHPTYLTSSAVFIRSIGLVKLTDGGIGLRRQGGAQRVFAPTILSLTTPQRAHPLPAHRVRLLYRAGLNCGLLLDMLERAFCRQHC